MNNRTQSTINNQQSAIIDVLQYFSFFNYSPTLDEIYTFLQKKTSKRHLVSILEKMEKESLVKSCKLDDGGWKIEERSLRMEDRRWIKEKSYYLPSTLYLLPSAVNTPRYTLGEYGKNIKYQKANSKNHSQVISTPTLRRGRNPAKTGTALYLSKRKNNIAIQQYNNFLKRQIISNNKLNSWRFKLYIKLLFLSPQIKLIGLSGSVAMLNADESHDIDLFIITAKNRLYTGRFIALILAQILGMRRRRHQINQNRSEVRKIRNQKNSDKSVKSDLSDVSDISDIRSLPTLRSLPNSSEIKDKICLNLFFDESNLSVPDNKKTEYVAHEVLQMKALVQKDDIYLRFIDANRWVFDIFPNAPRVIPRSEATRNLAKRNNVFYAPFGRWISHFVRNDRVSQWFEILLKSFQLHFIRKHQTTEIVTDSQLWFHPEDFARKIKI